MVTLREKFIEKELIEDNPRETEGGQGERVYRFEEAIAESFAKSLRVERYLIGV